MTKSVSIIGAGTIGGYGGYLLGRAGYSVSIYEDHKVIGEPCHCTGIITSSILKMVDLPTEIVLNKLSSVKVIGPNGKSCVLPTTDIVVDRVKLDEHFVGLAEKEGAKLYRSHKMVSCDLKEKKFVISHEGKEETHSFSTLVGADGPNSSLAKLLNPSLKRKHWIGPQAVISGTFDKSQYEVYLNNDFCKGFFAWVVPSSSTTAVVGLAVRDRASHHFKKFMEMRFGKAYKEKVIRYLGGLIPLYDSGINCYKNGVYLVGDAGGHVKATTGGGIIPGMKAARGLVASLKSGKDYDKTWRKQTGFNLFTHLKIRHMLDTFSDTDYNRLIEYMGGKRVQKVMKNSDREYPASFALRLFFAEPRLARFATRLL
ncbi:MAG: NAD(P)/FAD-dependent oxidoreductase [Nanoarchaeota archaeon]|nr:NAD(P)/FAD-dependent oxidoreductase [Nanoarchaeota archaeon]